MVTCVAGRSTIYFSANVTGFSPRPTKIEYNNELAMSKKEKEMACKSMCFKCHPYLYRVWHVLYLKEESFLSKLK